MRIGLVSPYSWTVPGGVNHHIEHLADELEERGHETWIIAPVGAVTPARRSVDSRRQAMAERFIPMGSAVPLPSNGSLAYVNFSPQIIMRMDRAIRYARFDVLHVHEPCHADGLGHGRADGGVSGGRHLPRCAGRARRSTTPSSRW